VDFESLESEYEGNIPLTPLIPIKEVLEVRDSTQDGIPNARDKAIKAALFKSKQKAQQKFEAQATIRQAARANDAMVQLQMTTHRNMSTIAPTTKANVRKDPEVVSPGSEPTLNVEVPRNGFVTSQATTHSYGTRKSIVKSVPSRYKDSILKFSAREYHTRKCLKVSVIKRVRDIISVYRISVKEALSSDRAQESHTRLDTTRETKEYSAQFYVLEAQADARW